MVHVHTYKYVCYVQHVLYLLTVGLCQRSSHSVGPGVAGTSGAVCEHDILDGRGSRGHQTGAQRPERLPQEAAESGELWKMCDVHLVIMCTLDMPQSCIRGYTVVSSLGVY